MPLADPRSVGCGATDEAGRRRLREKRSDADEREARQHRCKIRQEQQRQTGSGEGERPPQDRPRAEGRTARPASGVVKIEGRKTK